MISHGMAGVSPVRSADIGSGLIFNFVLLFKSGETKLYFNMPPAHSQLCGMYSKLCSFGLRIEFENGYQISGVP